MSLLQEIQNDPLALGYSTYTVEAPGKIADMLNTKSYSAPKSRMISERGIMDHYTDGPVAADIVLSKLEAYSVSGQSLSGVIKRMLKFLAMPEGIDIGSPKSAMMLDALTLATVLTVAEASKLKQLAYQPASRAEVLFGLDTFITEQQVREALNG